MKKTFLIITLLTTGLFACKERKNPSALHKTEEAQLVKDTSAASPPVVTDIVDTPNTPVEAPVAETEAAILPDSINFEKYAVEVQDATNKAPLDFNSNPGARYFRTRIIDAYKSNTVDFAGHYIGVVFGCGGGCIAGFMVDVRDGKIYGSPLGEENMCTWDVDKLICQPYSRLFISAICKEDEDSKKLHYKAYVWNEDKKVFEKADPKDFLIAKP